MRCRLRCQTGRRDGPCPRMPVSIGWPAPSTVIRSHSPTLHSDGSLPVAGVAALAVSAGLDLIADCAWRKPIDPRPPLAEIWHSGWLDRRWGEARSLGGSPGVSTPFRSAAATGTIPGSVATPGTPTTWVLVDAAAESPNELPEAVLAGLRAGRTAVSADRDGPVVLRDNEELLVLGGDAALLVAPDGSHRQIRGDYVTLPATGPGQLLIDREGRILSVCH